MSTTVSYPIGKVTVEVLAESTKDAIRQLSEFAEVFGERQCGSCESEDIYPVYRNSKGYDFYELACSLCGARLQFGQTREGNKLFPKRRDMDTHQEIGVRGWAKFKRQESRPASEPDF